MNEKIASAALALPTGCFVTFILLSIFTGGPQNAFFIYLVTIVCTAGVSLILWVPLWFAVGGITLAIIHYVSKYSNNKKDNSKPPLTSDQKALTDYIRTAKSKGATENNIFALLKSNGWSETSIHEAFGLIAIDQA